MPIAIRLLLLSVLFSVGLAGPMCAQVSNWKSPSLDYWIGVTDNNMDWPSANGLATKFGGNLVTIRSAAEETWLKQQFGAYTTSAWIGYNDILNEGTWAWASGETPTPPYSNWCSGQPDDSGGEDWGKFECGGAGWNDARAGSAPGGKQGLIEVASSDCDGDGVPDSYQIYLDSSLDSNGDGILDVCADCNGNGIPDQDELSPATDCDGDGILDECEIADDPSLDCDGDTVLDSCQIAGDPSLDCDGDLILDSCQIAGDPLLDCDFDDVLDSCQIFSDPAMDCDGDNVLDYCQIAGDPSLDQDGDGVLDSCQCAFSNFCGSTANSTGLPAVLGWSGSASISAADLTLIASDVPPFQFGMFFYGSDDWFPIVMGDGLLCVAPPLYRIRTAVFSDSSGVASLTLDYGTKPLSSGKGAVTAFSSWRFQLWYRDPFSGGAGSNTTDGLLVTFCP